MCNDLRPQSEEDDQPDVERVPLATQRVYDRLVRRFRDMLVDQALCNMKRRGSKTPTDADLDDAFRHLTRHHSPSPLQRSVGAGLLILGGIFIPLAATSWMLTLGGIVMCVAGIYVREFMEQ